MNINLEALRNQEDEALKLTESWSRSMQLLVYELLNRRHSCTMDHIEDNRLTAWVREQKESP